MISIEKVLFPGILAGCVFLVVVTSLIASPHRALAEAEPAAAALNAASVEQALPVVPLVVGQPQEAQTAPTSVPAAEAADQPQAAEEPQTEPPATADPSAAAGQPVDAPQSNENPAECSLSSGYPDTIRQWCSLIDKYAAENGVEPNLIAAVMYQESGGNPQAYSRNGAVGLLQVMPRDGLASGFMCINGPCFGSRPSTQELFDPEFNISYGAKMLAGLIRKHGNVREALRAYGPMNMGYRYADIVLGIASRYE